MTKHTAAPADDHRLVRRLVMPAIAFAALAFATSDPIGEAGPGQPPATGIAAAAGVPQPDPRITSDWPW